MKGHSVEKSVTVADEGNTNISISLPSRGALLAATLASEENIKGVFGRLVYVGGNSRVVQRLGTGYLRTIGGRFIDMVSWSGRITFDSHYENNVEGWVANRSGSTGTFTLHVSYEGGE